ncbi:hypothetical protein [Medusavirus stheno T3]|uniref:Uncharacterized protein n=1 Tax=Medusavirus stheno T3 TaxID=3069717 RepID=A0A7S8BDK8_9VIRU|nr:hypothetical protein QKU73_gp118 [Acanthamoeba castellanii medusavirus]QPB44299.1 hypothetical protein [Medusavirus stheno T3]
MSAFKFNHRHYLGLCAATGTYCGGMFAYQLHRKNHIDKISGTVLFWSGIYGTLVGGVSVCLPHVGLFFAVIDTAEAIEASYSS